MHTSALCSHFSLGFRVMIRKIPPNPIAFHQHHDLWCTLQRKCCHGNVLHHFLITMCCFLQRKIIPKIMGSYFQFYALGESQRIPFPGILRIYQPFTTAIEENNSCFIYNRGRKISGWNWLFQQPVFTRGLSQYKDAILPVYGFRL